MTMVLRTYQRDAVDAVYDYLRTHTGNPCVVIPTGGGKTLVLAQICHDAVIRWQSRVIILAHVKELLEQNAAKVRAADPDLSARVGVYSAGLRSRDTEHDVIVAGIQSVYRRATDLGRFDLAIIDEAHLIPPDGVGMYQQMIRDMRIINPDIRIIGLTATPYRLDSGTICGHDKILTSVVYDANVRDLIDQGYLSPVRSRGSQLAADLSEVHVRGGEFVASELEAAFTSDEAKMSAALCEVIDRTQDRKAVLVFCSGVDHGEQVSAKLMELTGTAVPTVFGDTAPGERAALLTAFKSRQIKYLVNCNVLTTGFDAPNVDAIVLLRATLSPGLYVQMVGRGLRLAEGKTDCLVLDYGGNIMRHGPIDAVRVVAKSAGKGDGDAPMKTCPECDEMVPISVRVCPACQYEWPAPEAQHDGRASELSILSEKATITTYDVTHTMYREHVGKSGIPLLKVSHEIGKGRYEFEWVCLVHEGFAGAKARSWWRRRSEVPPPSDIETAVDLANSGALAVTRSITLREPEKGSKYPEIIGWDLGEIPQAPEMKMEAVDDIPY